jgi:ABC-type nitrate/sulfonate/bicarbonate transport system substrate-binding protein
MNKIRVGGVPEHFNFAWHIALKDKLFENSGIDLQWIDCHGGTGEMTHSLKNNKIDLAVVLTEGIVKSIFDGNQFKIIQTFVKSPLIWGIHVSSKSSFNKINQLKKTKAAISRIGSGSHLMAYVNAQQQGWDISKDLSFEIVKDLSGGVKALTNDSADYFLWEKFTTKRFVDEGILKRIGECPTPWPCFVIAARDSFINREHNKIKRVLDIVNNVTKKIKNVDNINESISFHYNQNINDVKEWLKQTNWSNKNISEKALDDIQNKLLKLKIISNKLNYKELVFKLN